MTLERIASNDDYCKRCETRAPLKRGGTLCKRCARDVANEENPTLREISRDGADQVGRPMLSSNTAGGNPSTPGPNE